jgi:hypothetical protein
MPGPELAELVALGGELADEVGELAVVGLRPASERRMRQSLAARSQSSKKLRASESKKTKRAQLEG